MQIEPINKEHTYEDMQFSIESLHEHTASFTYIM